MKVNQTNESEMQLTSGPRLEALDICAECLDFSGAHLLRSRQGRVTRATRPPLERHESSAWVTALLASVERE
jgi:hypothetical protein